MGAPGKPFHEKPPVVTEARTSKPGPEAPGQVPAEALDAGRPWAEGPGLVT